MRIVILILLLVIVPQVQAQQIDLDSTLKAVSAKASKITDLDLDSAMLGLASKFLSDRNVEEAAAKKLIEGLKSIHVRVLEFNGDQQYSASDLELLRTQVDCSRPRKPSGCSWRRFLRIQDNVQRGGPGEDVEVWMNTNGGVSDGLLLISLEPRELVVVSIEGPIKPEDLAMIGGHFGIPKIQVKE